jgi:uncharacterized protein (DUF983 family)
MKVLVVLTYVTESVSVVFGSFIGEPASHIPLWIHPINWIPKVILVSISLDRVVFD